MRLISVTDMPYGKQFVIKSSVPLPREYRVAGLDPGQVNMGFAISRPPHDEIAAYQILMNAENTLERILLVGSVLKEILTEVQFSLRPYIAVACVEQAAFAAPYGQAQLAEARTAGIISLMMFSGGVGSLLVTPPAQIRKAVFGNGKQKAETMWPGVVEKDAASAVACLLFAAQAPIQTGLQESVPFVAKE